MSALICGSIAYDTIMVFHDHFKNHILPEQVHILNVSFLVPDMRREYGGCAGNIAYNLGLLGGAGLPMATVGSDFSPYEAWMDRCGIGRDHIRVLDDTYTAQAYITTDQDDNQITAFHPGAMNENHHQVINADSGAAYGIVAPDGKAAMIQHATVAEKAAALDQAAAVAVREVAAFLAVTPSIRKVLLVCFGADVLLAFRRARAEFSG